MLIRLDPPIPLLTPRGEAVAHIYSDGGLESECFWVCFCQDGAIVEFANSVVRACRNLTIGRVKPELPGQEHLLVQKTHVKPRHLNGRRTVLKTNGAGIHNRAGES